jgi:hypothetical protein
MSQSPAVRANPSVGRELERDAPQLLSRPRQLDARRIAVAQEVEALVRADAKLYRAPIGAALAEPERESAPLRHRAERGEVEVAHA